MSFSNASAPRPMDEVLRDPVMDFVARFPVDPKSDADTPKSVTLGSTSGTLSGSAAIATPRNTDWNPQGHSHLENPSGISTSTAILMTETMPPRSNISAPGPKPVTEEFVVEAVNLRCKCERESSSLRGINFTLPKGKICGIVDMTGEFSSKLIQCIFGAEQPHEGHIRVFGQVPGTAGARIPGRDVGFMPALNALYPELTIEENLHFFGMLHGMSDALIKQRIGVLTEALSLPLKTLKIALLWDDGKKRVSLAAALIHSPSFLILRSPTSDLDVGDRDAIWRHLKNLNSKEGVSILFITSDFEEALQADIVCFMNSGLLSVQNSPHQFLMDHKCETLREVYPKLFNRMELFSAVLETAAEIMDHLTKIYTCGRMGISDRKIDRESTSRNPSSSFISRLRRRKWSRPSLYVISTLLRKDLARVNRHLYMLAFTVLQCLWLVTGYASVGSHGDLETTHYYSTSSRSFVTSCSAYNQIRRLTLLGPHFSEPDTLEVKLFQNPCTDLIYGSERESSSTQMLQSAIVLPIASYGTMFLTASVIMKEFSAGTAHRCLRAGVGLGEIIASQVLSQLCRLCLLVFLLIWILLLPWNNQSSNAILVFPLLFSQGVKGITQGLAISSFWIYGFGSEAAAIFLVFLIVLCDIFLSGKSILAKLIPEILISTAPAEALRCILDRGWNFDDEVLTGYLSNICWSMVFAIIAFIFFKLSRQTLFLISSPAAA